MLKVKSDINLRFNYFKVDDVDPDLSLYVVNEIKVDKTKAKRIGLYYFGSQDGNWLYYESSLFGIKLQVLIKNLTGKKTEVFMTKPYYLAKRPTTLWRDIHSFLQIKLLQKNALFLHSACISSQADGFLISAFADTGKTLTVLKCLENKAFHYVSDDLVIVDNDGFAWSMPRLINFDSLKRAGYLKNQSVLRKNLFSKISKMPLLFTYAEPIDAIDIYKALNLTIKEKTRINKIFFLENDDESSELISENVAAWRLRLLNKIEFSYFPEIVYVYSYLNQFFDYCRLEKTQDDLISNLSRNATSCILKSKKPDKFASMLLQGVMNHK